MNLLLTRSVLCKCETLDRGHAVECCLWAFHNPLAGIRNVRGDDRSLDPLPIDVDGAPDPIRGITVCEVVGPAQSDVELSAVDGLHERRCAHLTVLGRMFGERRAIDADGDRSTGKTVGVHLGRCNVGALMLIFVMLCGGRG